MTLRDPFEAHLKKATVLFEVGEVVQAGQIWQAILKKSPYHNEARAGLYKVKLYFDARATQDGLALERKQTQTQLLQLPLVDPAPQLPEHSPANELVKLLEQGCALYDAGHSEEAIAKWELVLAQEPQNVLAKGYITGAQRSAGLHAQEEIDRLLQDGCTLFEMGQSEDALHKWEKLLKINPEHELANAYLKNARRDLGFDTLSDGAVPAPIEPPATSIHPAPEPDLAPAVDIPAHIDKLMREATHLFDMGMNVEAIQKWDQVLAEMPGNEDASTYRDIALRDEEREIQAQKQAQATQEARLQSQAARPVPLDFSTPPAPAPPAPTPSVPAPPPPPPITARTPPPIIPIRTVQLGRTEQPIAPPTPLTTPMSPKRKGLELPHLLRQLEAEIPVKFRNPKLILAILAGVILLNGAYLLIRWNRGETLLKQKTASFKDAALVSVARNLELADLTEAPDAIRNEANAVLSEDPLRAYYRAQELVRLNPLDGPAAQLMGRVSAAMAQATDAGQGSTKDVDKFLQAGDLDASERMLVSLLKKTPDDVELKSRLARLGLNLAQVHATKERWSEAEDQLKRCRAMFPTDKTWGARLVFLGRIKAMGAEERKAWIPLLG